MEDTTGKKGYIVKNKITRKTIGTNRFNPVEEKESGGDMLLISKKKLLNRLYEKKYEGLIY